MAGIPDGAGHLCLHRYAELDRSCESFRHERQDPLDVGRHLLRQRPHPRAPGLLPQPPLDVLGRQRPHYRRTGVLLFPRLQPNGVRKPHP